MELEMGAKASPYRLGASCDWSRERFTLDEGLSEAGTTAGAGLLIALIRRYISVIMGGFSRGPAQCYLWVKGACCSMLFNGSKGLLKTNTPMLAGPLTQNTPNHP